LVALVLAVSPVRGDAVTILQPGPGLNNGTDDGSTNRGKDAGLQVEAGGNAGTNEVMLLYHSPCNVGLHPAYLAFNVGGLPAEDVRSAKIAVYAQVYFNGSGWPWQVSPVLSLHRVIQPWSELDVTLGSGPSFDDTAIEIKTVTTVGGGSWGSPFMEYEGWLEFDVTALYRDWVSGAQANHGVMFRIDNEYCANGDEFVLFTSDYAADATLRPKLVVTSTSTTITLQPGPGLNDNLDTGNAVGGKDSAFVWPDGSNSGADEVLRLYNSPCNIGVTPAYLGFDLEGIPAGGLTAAKIAIYTSVYWNGSGWPWQVSPVLSLRRVTQPWGEMEVTAVHQPACDETPLASHTITTVGGGTSGSVFMEYQGWLEFEVTDLCRAWLTGILPNDGVMFRIDNEYCANGDECVLFSSDYAADPSLRPKLVLRFSGGGNGAPSIASQPQSVTNLAGTTAAFEVRATGTEPLTYQWLKEGVTIPNATGSVLRIAGVQVSDAGNYTVVVTDANGLSATNSTPAVLAVVPGFALAVHLEVQGAIVTLSWQGLERARYQARVSNDLANWTDYGPPLEGVFGVMSIQCPSSSAPSQFFRVLATQ
jgi:hypothetical protein